MALLPTGVWDESFSAPFTTTDVIAGENAGCYTGNWQNTDEFTSRYQFKKLRRDGSFDPAFRHGELLKHAIAPGTAAPDVLHREGLRAADIPADRYGQPSAAFSGGRLWIGGGFTRIGQQRADGLAILDSGPAAGYAAWGAATLGRAGLPADAASDADKDGCGNFMEYAAGSDPLVPDAGLCELQELTHEPPCYAIPHNVEAPEITVVVETSSDLIAWRTATTAEITRKDTGTRTAFAILPGPGRRWFRVRYVRMP